MRRAPRSPTPDTPVRARVRRLPLRGGEWASRCVRPAAAALALVGLAGGSSPTAAQGVRISGTTTAQYADVRLLVPDSIPAAAAPGTGALRRAPDGTPVSCVPGAAFCHYFRAGQRASTAPLIQDLELSAWGLGQGVRLYAHLRGRLALAGQTELWPRADQPFDALAAFLELDRPRFRARAGRQWKTSGLGFYDFDGASILLRPLASLSFEAYGGWSIVRGLFRPHTSAALAALEDFVPDERAYILGGELRLRPLPRLSLGALYQREIATSRIALYSDRLAADARLDLGRVPLTGELELDLAAGWLNQARLRADLPLAPGLGTSFELRRYRPFFELWTIWGAFSPVGFDEARSAASWSPPGGPVTLRLDAGWRRYDETQAGLSFAPLRSTGWRLGGAATWRPAPAWTLEGGYRADVHFGASRGEGEVGARLELGEAGYIAVSGVAFQGIQEFRVDQGTVVGLGLDAGLRLGPDARIAGGLSAYRHLNGRGAAAVDWTQTRGSLRVEWTLGSEPGHRATAGAAP